MIRAKLVKTCKTTLVWLKTTVPFFHQAGGFAAETSTKLYRNTETQKLTATTQRSTELAAGGNFSLWLYQVTAISSQVPPSSPVVCTEVTESSLCSVILLLCLLCSCTGNFPSAVRRFHSARTVCILLTSSLLWFNSGVLLKWCLSAAALFGWHGLGAQMIPETVFASAFSHILTVRTFFPFSSW